MGVPKKAVENEGKPLPMQGVTFHAVIRYLRNHNPRITRARVQEYFHPNERETAGKWFDREMAITRLSGVDQGQTISAADQKLLLIERRDGETIGDALFRAFEVAP